MFDPTPALVGTVWEPLGNHGGNRKHSLAIRILQRVPTVPTKLFLPIERKFSCAMSRQQYTHKRKNPLGVCRFSGNCGNSRQFPHSGAEIPVPTAVPERFPQWVPQSGHVCWEVNR
jgi:hypothetical protein